MTRSTVLWSAGCLAAVLSSPSAAAQCETQKLQAPDFGAPFTTQDQFGFAVDVDEAAGVLVVGTPFADLPGMPNAGAAWVYRRDAAGWAPETKLTASDATAFLDFGFNLRVSGDLLVVSANGLLYPFRFDGADWHEEPAIPAAPGVALALDGDYLAIGHSGLQSVTVYERARNTWRAAQVIPNPLPGMNDFFGISVALDDDLMVVGGFGQGLQVDVAHVFRLAGDTWGLEDTLTPSGTAVLFGEDVDVDGGRIVVSDSNWSDGSFVLGALYVFEDSGGGVWTQTAQLVRAEQVAFDDFAQQVRVSGDVIVSGANHHNAPFAASGAIFVFQQLDGVWHQAPRIAPDDVDFFDNFGRGIALDGTTIVAGSVGHDEGATENVGAAYVIRSNRVLDLGGGLAGFGGAAPALALEPSLCGGADIEVALTGARPSATAALVLGLSTIHAPFKGGVLVPALDVLVFLPTDGAGELAIMATWPAGAAGLTTWWQVLVQDPDAPVGWAISNTIAGDSVDA